MSSLSVSELKTFLKEKMRMSGIYQPAIIKSLLKSGGTASRQKIAEDLQKYLPKRSVDEYHKLVWNTPKKVLESHGIVTIDQDNFKLNLDLSSSSNVDIQDLVEICEKKIDSFLSRRSSVPFIVGKKYTREDIYNILNIPDNKRGGDWNSGYHKEGEDWYIFANIGFSGSTGHEHNNYWNGQELVWRGKSGSHVNQNSIKSLLEPSGDIHIFTREKNREPFTYQGIADYVDHQDTVPVTIRWKFHDPQNGYPNSDFSEKVAQIIKSIRQYGFFFQPWQIANFITAVKTKPFLILAGISGTGKSKLPGLIGRFTGAKVHMIPVRPDWTDSTELIGYQNLQDEFVNGHLLHICEQAQDDPNAFHICLLDEMNLARVEQYFAEVLSLIEDRVVEGDEFKSRHPLTRHRPNVFLPHNVLMVGTVNMDETTHGFSRKVLDRAFTLEMSDITLDNWRKQSLEKVSVEWSPHLWKPMALKLSDIEPVSPKQEKLINDTIAVLKDVNDCLKPAQLQVGYRVRDEVCLYLLHAQDLKDHFVDESGEKVQPLDLALHMKILPRIQGSSLAIHDTLERLLRWCLKPQSQDIEEVVNKWKKEPQIWKQSRYPHTAGRLLTMYARYQQEGFTSYWL